MSKIEVFYKNGKLALLVDGVSKEVRTEDELLAALMALGMTKDYVTAEITRLREKGNSIEFKL